MIACLPSCASGLTYESFYNECCTPVHVLIVNPSEHAITPFRAWGGEVRRETVAAIANRYQAMAAINGGFFKENGDPAGALKIDRRWFGTPTKPRGAIGWSDTDQKVLIDRISTSCSLEEWLSGCEIQVIPASTPPHTPSEEWRDVKHIVGGTPVLVHQGALIDDFSPEQTSDSFLNLCHPRTAVGIRSNGDWVFVVVDGRIPNLGGGMTMSELAQLMVDLGCVEALNLDGGGSSTMVIDGVVVNRPVGEIEENGKWVRAVSDAILIF